MMKRHSAPPPGLTREEAQALGGLVSLFTITAAWWALALWPVDAGPAWLERTRFVCFGVNESGLPDAGGWIGLIGGPFGMLAILAVGWRAGFRDLLTRARTSRPVAAALASLALAGLVLVTGAAVRVQQARSVVADSVGRRSVVETDPRLSPESHPRLDRPAPPLALTAQHGGPLDIAGLRGTPVLVTFAYAHCQTICPIVVRDVLAAGAALIEGGQPPAVLIVTVDPWRDTPSRLPAMAESWRLPENGAWVLTGSVDDVEATLDAWEVPRSRDAVTGQVTHPSLVYVIDADGRLAFATAGGADILVRLVKRL